MIRLTPHFRPSHRARVAAGLGVTVLLATLPVAGRAYASPLPGLVAADNRPEKKFTVLSRDGSQASSPGAAYAWGTNTSGQVGNPSGQTKVPVPVSGLSSGVSAITGGGFHSLAIKNGAAYAWGNNDNGQLGNSSTVDSTVPVAVNGLGSGVSAVAGGYYYSLAVQNGAAYAWGANNLGQLGNNSTINSPLPVPVTGLSSGVSAVAGGGYHSAAIQNGAVYAWGLNSNGQLGNNSTLDSRVPVPVARMDRNVTAIATGNNHSLAIQNGTAYGWGYNGDGQLGNGTTISTLAPLPVSGLSTGVTSIAASQFHSLAVQNGRVYAWGTSNEGQLGNGTRTGSSYTPILIEAPGMTNIVAVAAGNASSYALSADGSLWAWGFGGLGELGLGNTTSYYTPQHVLPPDGASYVALDADAKGRHAVAILTATLVVPAVTTTSSGPGAYNFSFPTLATLVYQLQRSDDLLGWTNVGAVVSGDGSVKNLSDTSNAARTFWRISVQRAPN